MEGKNPTAQPCQRTTAFWFRASPIGLSFVICRQGKSAGCGLRYQVSHGLLSTASLQQLRTLMVGYGWLIYAIDVGLPPSSRLVAKPSKWFWRIPHRRERCLSGASEGGESLRRKKP